ncbi:MAG: CopD family protein, partial [Alphaproteobacteria bacterium]|nr:CopD family protein [Alphaproteobacteria bacterium]
MDWLFALYPWIKALHIAAVVFWMAGMLYLPRLFIYHLETEPGAADSERFKVMERRLLRVIVNPAMIAAFLFGGLLLWVSP